MKKASDSQNKYDNFRSPYFQLPGNKIPTTEKTSEDRVGPSNSMSFGKAPRINMGIQEYRNSQPKSSRQSTRVRKSRRKSEGSVFSLAENPSDVASVVPAQDLKHLGSPDSPDVLANEEYLPASVVSDVVSPRRKKREWTSNILPSDAPRIKRHKTPTAPQESIEVSEDELQITSQNPGDRKRRFRITSGREPSEQHCRGDIQRTAFAAPRKKLQDTSEPTKFRIIKATSGKHFYEQDDRVNEPVFLRLTEDGTHCKFTVVTSSPRSPASKRLLETWLSIDTSSISKLRHAMTRSNIVAIWRSQVASAPANLNLEFEDTKSAMLFLRLMPTTVFETSETEP